jgi:CDP-diacylglycerol--serine O-phosphatidyltransferase
MKLKYIYPFIPNAITLTSMCLGLTALRFSYVRENIYYSLVLLLIAAFLDAIDGKVARRLKVESPIGAQLDSLADFLNFCVTPALIAYEWHLKGLYFFGWVATLIFLVGGAYRLARFNVMYNEGAENVATNYFIGMPTPAGAVFIFLPIVLELKGAISTTTSIYTGIYITCLAGLMISHVKTPSSKLLHISKKAAPLALLMMAAIVAGFIYAPLDTYLAGIVGYSFLTLYLLSHGGLYHRKNERF